MSRHHRPSPSLIISILALFFAMSGTAFAATGGTFVLGRSNTATAVTSLTNSKGTALNLNSTGTTPPLTVSNGIQVPNLNASLLGGKLPSSFLPVGGTAADSSKLGGTPASGYMKGGGTTQGARQTMTPTQTATLLTVPGAYLYAYCDTNGGTFFIHNNGGAAGETVLWWSQDGVGQNTDLTQSQSEISPLTKNPYVIMVQVNNLTSISTFTLNQWNNTTTGECHFTAQVVTTNG